jgi:hypothetical protein
MEYLSGYLDFESSSDGDGKEFELSQHNLEHDNSLSPWTGLSSFFNDLKSRYLPNRRLATAFFDDKASV